MTNSAFVIRPFDADTFDTAMDMLDHAFGETTSAEARTIERQIMEFDRTLGVYEGERIIGTAAAFSRELTVPGTASIPTACVSWVAVDPLRRRRGVLRALMRRQLDDIAAAQEAVAILWSSESSIYGRFGYGQSVRQASLEVTSRSVRLRTATDDALRTGVPEELRKDLRTTYDTARGTRPGLLSRSEPWWDYRMIDVPEHRDGATALRTVVHDGPNGPDGYVIYSIKAAHGPSGPDGRVNVREMVANTPVAEATLWRHLLELDLTRTVQVGRSPADPTVLYLIDDPRQFRMKVSDSLWTRLVDVPAALAARRYARDIDVVLDVHDAFLPANTGRWRLTAGPDGASCEPAGSADADLSLSSTELGAAYLGDTSLAVLGRAGLVDEHTEGSLQAAAAAFAWPVRPYSPEVF